MGAFARNGVDFVERSANGKLGAPAGCFAVLASALMCGFMWRVRGDSGFGSMWGMFCFTVTLTLLIFALFGNRKKMSYEAIPVAVILAGITNSGWGTLNCQMGGYLDSSQPFTGEAAARVMPMDPFSGLWIMLLLGFGWMPLFAMFISSLFSKKKYGVRRYILLIAVYYAVMLLFKAFAAHYILDLISPQAVEYFKTGLADKGIDATPMSAYLKHFDNIAWAKKIPFGRNYFASIESISQAAGALACSLTALIAFKDKITGLISLAIDFICAVSITAADIFLVIDSDSGFFAGVNAPAFLKGGSWSMWEYGTGFLIGFFVMLLLVCLPASVTGGEGKFTYEEPFKSRNLHCLYSALLTFTVTFVLTLARPLSVRLFENLCERGLLGEKKEDIFTIAVTAGVSVIAFIIFLIIFRKNIVMRGMPVPVARRTDEFCARALPLYFLACGALYFCVGNAYAIRYPYGQIISSPTYANTFGSAEFIVFFVAAVSFLLFYVCYGAAMKLRRK